MYWSMTRSVGDILALLLFLALCTAGGWFLVRAGFRLSSKDRVVVGAGLGLTLATWLANLLSRWIVPPVSFWLSAGLLVVVGAGLWWRQPDRRLRLGQELRPWLLIVAVLVLGYFFLRIGRGLAIFDDRKNLSLISLMAAGDIPPHFYMNPDFYFRYHYAFQLFGAMLMRLGGLFPWSAFDLAKGIAGALAVGLSVVLGRRATGRWAGGAALGFVVLFASGARWLLLLLPSELVSAAANGVTLWGSAAQTASNLPNALGAPWVIDGGPLVPFPFAFVNGILQPLVLYLQAGPVSLGMIALLLLLILYPARERRWGWGVLTLVLALWALAAEAEFALFVLGVALACAVLLLKKNSGTHRGELWGLVGVAALATVLGFLQGGTLTEVARSVASRASNPDPSAALSMGGFSLSAVPAIVSSHLGELRLGNPGELAIGLLELGPALLLAPLAVWWVVRAYRRQRLLPLAFGASTLLGFILPIFVRYEVDRDISRLTHYALVGWILLAAAPVAVAWRQGTMRRRGVIAAIAGLTVFGGLVVTGPMLTSLTRGVLSNRVESIDAGMAREMWNRLEPGSLVLDSDTWRAVALTGRLTRSAPDSVSVLEEWTRQVADPNVALLTAAGIDYVYVDQYWWNEMPGSARASFLDPCVRVVAEGKDNALNGRRWLFDIRSCPAG